MGFAAFLDSSWLAMSVATLGDRKQPWDLPLDVFLYLKDIGTNTGLLSRTSSALGTLSTIQILCTSHSNPVSKVGSEIL